MITRLVMLLLVGVTCNSFAQISAIGVQPKINFAHQLFIDQNVKFGEAVTGSDRLTAAGIDVFIDYKLSERWKLRAKTGIESKGFSNRYLIYDKIAIQNNKYNYVSLDAAATFDVAIFENSRPYISVGLSSGYVYRTSAKTSYQIDGFFLPPLEYVKYDRFNLGVIAALGWSFDDVLWLEVEWNRDIIAPIKTTDLKVYNSVYSVNIGVNVLSVIRNIQAA